jgi:hypothetical protein
MIKTYEIACLTVFLKWNFRLVVQPLAIALGKRLPGPLPKHTPVQVGPHDLPEG